MRPNESHTGLTESRAKVVLDGLGLLPSATAEMMRDARVLGHAEHLTPLGQKIVLTSVVIENGTWEVTVYRS